MCTAGGEVVSVRCCSGGLNYYPHRLRIHLTLSVSSVIHIPCSFVPLPLLSDFNTRSCDCHMTTSHPSPAHLPCSTASCSALHFFSSVSPEPLHQPTHLHLTWSSTGHTWHLTQSVTTLFSDSHSTFLCSSVPGTEGGSQ